MMECLQEEYPAVEPFSKDSGTMQNLIPLSSHSFVVRIFPVTLEFCTTSGSPMTEDRPAHDDWGVDQLVLLGGKSMKIGEVHSIVRSCSGFRCDSILFGAKAPNQSP